ncbi:hypothetical protein K435DRAFT_873795 [Dendrothele bispora CBS 962.96]|uniref:FAD/NAD(P)-binding domain-containing protein n=1 Tax=Dendrothele bispora (strain CBS 962.96) TaxID=1314807 RepID=A0A4S8KYN4_DENBC|nr:hypothetical protein K435DRAFT_873795 [Dendrothele bispora CBS 962.96]
MFSCYVAINNPSFIFLCPAPLYPPSCNGVTNTYERDLTKYGSRIYVLVPCNKIRASNMTAKRLMNNPKITILQNNVATDRQDDHELLRNLRIRNVQTGSKKDLAANGLFYALSHEPATEIFRTQLQTDPDGYIVSVPGTTRTSVRGVFAAV